jgi:hypothetical protein
MSAPSLPRSTSPSPFLEGAAWRWLLDLRSRLNVLVEVVDERGQPLLPQVGGDTGQQLRAALAHVDAAALDSATRRIGSQEPVAPSRVDGLIFVVFVLDPERRLRLVVAEPAESTSGRAGQELAGVGEWLARSIASERAAQAGSGSVVNASDWHELAVLHRLLNQAASSGSAREVVRLFVEAMAIWSDADVRAYVGDLSGGFALDVALASADATAAPDTLQQPSIAAGGVERLSRERAADLGFAGREPIGIARIHTTRTAPWLLAQLGPFDRRAEVRLAAFADVLGPRLDAAAEVEASRLLWAMMQRLMIPDAAAPTKGIAAALGELSEIVSCDAALRVLGPGDRVLLEAGDAALAHAAGAEGVDRLTVPFRADATCTAVLVLGASFGRPFTLREQHLASVAGSVLQTWLDGLLEKGLLPVERRRQSASSFDDLLGLALHTPRGDQPVSFLLLAPSPTRVSSAGRQGAIAALRRHLRPFDAVGVLASGQIGIWLPGAARQHAMLIRDRLYELLRAPAVLVSLGEAAIGVASGTSSVARAADLIAAARADIGPQPEHGDR